jgi:hypothetical protein
MGFIEPHLAIQAEVRNKDGIIQRRSEKRGLLPEEVNPKINMRSMHSP